MMTQKRKELAELAAQAEGETDCKDALDAVKVFTDGLILPLYMQRFIERIMMQDMRAYSASSNIYTKADANITLVPMDVEAVEHKHCENDNKAEDSEKHLKKLIKYAKTPMERKMYEKKLNALYKKRKKNEKSDRAT